MLDMLELLGGESQRRVSYKKYSVILNNRKINHGEIIEFLQWSKVLPEVIDKPWKSKFMKPDKAKLIVEFSNCVKYSRSHTERVLGEANFWPPIINIIRPSVAVFLHELAHIIAGVKYRHVNHGKLFVQVLDQLYETWFAWRLSKSRLDRRK